MSDSSRKETKMREQLSEIAEMRLIIHGWPTHTTVALTTRKRNGSENWDRRNHSWDLKLPQRDYVALPPGDQLWVILGALAASTKPPRVVALAEPPVPPTGGNGGLQYALPGSSSWT